jgi:hypothetical protein
MDPTARKTRFGGWRALVGALTLLAAVLATASCGDDDLFFPGDIPATATAVPTATPTPS